MKGKRKIIIHRNAKGKNATTKIPTIIPIQVNIFSPPVEFFKPPIVKKHNKTHKKTLIISVA